MMVRFVLYLLSLAVVGNAVEHHWDFTKGCFMVEKGIKCGGGFDMKKGFGYNCTGGMKMNFCAETKSEEIAEAVSSGLEEQFKSFVPTKERIFVDDNEFVLDAMGHFDDETVHENLADDFEMTVQAGGFFKVYWGCNITFSKKKGMFHKMVDCGGKAGEKGGWKAVPDEIAVELM